RGEFLQNSLGNDRRVSAFPLGERDSNRGMFRADRLPRTAASTRIHHIAVRLGGAVFQLLNHIAQVDRPAGVDSDYHLLQVFGSREEPPGLDLELAVIAGKAAHVTATVRALELTHHYPWREAI